MDYLFACLLKHICLRLCLVLSYDIACQWSIHLYSRLLELPPHVWTDLDMERMTFVVPKAHIRGHQLPCQMNFSLNLTPGMGRSDGEGIERPWVHLGPVATSTKEMGPGTCHDTLDDHLGNWNWGKLIGLGGLLRRRLLDVYESLAAQTSALQAFSEAQSNYVDDWLWRIKEWETDRSQPNPYLLTQSGLSEIDVRTQLAEEEVQWESAGVPSIHEVSPSKFIIAGLELEDEQ